MQQLKTVQDKTLCRSGHERCLLYMTNCLRCVGTLIVRIFLETSLYRSSRRKEALILPSNPQLSRWYIMVQLLGFIDFITRFFRALIFLTLSPTGLRYALSAVAAIVICNSLPGADADVAGSTSLTNQSPGSSRQGYYRFPAFY